MASPSKAYLEDHGHSFALSQFISSFFPVCWSIDDPLLVRWLGESTNSQNQGQWETSSTHLLKLPLGAILLDIRDIMRAKLSSAHRYIGMLLSQLPKMCAPGIFRRCLSEWGKSGEVTASFMYFTAFQSRSILGPGPLHESPRQWQCCNDLSHYTTAFAFDLPTNARTSTKAQANLL